jgi:hypothetical protein
MVQTQLCGINFQQFETINSKELKAKLLRERPAILLSCILLDLKGTSQRNRLLGSRLFFSQKIFIVAKEKMDELKRKY